MKFGLTLPMASAASPSTSATLAAFAEKAGFDSLWIGDHIAIPASTHSRYPYSSDGKMTWEPGASFFDPFVALTWMAAHTSRIKVGTSVLVLPIRQPLLVAKMAASLDWLSSGRLVLGVGSGWLAEEFELLEQDFETRGARMNEAIKVMRACWSDGLAEFHGHFHDLAAFGMGPKPAQGARLPVLIGGHGEAVLKRVVDLGDGWQPTRVSPEDFGEGVTRLKTLMADRGRAMSDLMLVARPGASRNEDSDLVEKYQASGADHLILDLGVQPGTLAEAKAAIAALARKFIRVDKGSTSPRAGESDVSRESSSARG